MRFGHSSSPLWGHDLNERFEQLLFEVDETVDLITFVTVFFYVVFVVFSGDGSLEVPHDPLSRTNRSAYGRGKHKG